MSGNNTCAGEGVSQTDAGKSEQQLQWGWITTATSADIQTPMMHSQHCLRHVVGEVTSDWLDRRRARVYLKIKMAALDAISMLQRCDQFLLSNGVAEMVDASNAGGMLLFLKDNFRVNKVLWCQLFALDSMMSLLDSLKSARELLSSSCPVIPGGARDRWKSLKLACVKKTEETEGLLMALYQQTTRMEEQQHTLKQLLQQLNAKKDLSEQLHESLLKTRTALQVCDDQLKKLQEKSEVVQGHMMAWQRLRNTLQEQVSASQETLQIQLMSVNQSEHSLQLLPYSTPDCNRSSDQLEPLRLSITWSQDDHFQLRVERSAGLLEEVLTGGHDELNAALLEVKQTYLSQADLLAEIQALRSSFAIDWCPTQRRLVCLMSSSLLCELSVDEGYPVSGHVHLLSVSRDGHPVDTSGLQPLDTPLSLTRWLLMLSSRLA
ncbi:uncharacterized protein si:dkey-225f5.4 [Synchiropus splendidus]|uniref:uncharacterized protein si:dkey-225f5.4 n=1 Tax=Synchiropus splendidus TaxID=270530 RepID=UPI00237EB6CF|nr:uncharacterized protein si:dkey-225f5.4 [Synchiropus splendidus]